MADYQRIYDERAEAYDALVAHEDHARNLIAALREIRPLEGLDVVETGAGTGRVTRMVAPFARSVRAFDRSAHMLDVARQRLAEDGARNVQVAVASHASLPVDDGSADLALEGWAFGHAVGWNPSGWVAGLHAHEPRHLRRGRAHEGCVGVGLAEAQARAGARHGEVARAEGARAGEHGLHGRVGGGRGRRRLFGAAAGRRERDERYSGRA